MISKTAAKLLNNPELKKDIPIIVQTAYILAGEEEMSYEAGCDEFLAKPIKFNNLLTTIGKYF